MLGSILPPKLLGNDLSTRLLSGAGFTPKSRGLGLLLKISSPRSAEYQREVLGCPKISRIQVDLGGSATCSGRGSGHRSAGEGPRASCPAHLHELRAGAHVLAETQQEILLRGQDLGQLWGPWVSGGLQELRVPRSQP